MNDRSKDADRKLLRNREAIWPNDPEINLKEDELDSLMKFFTEPGKVDDSWLRAALGRHFLYFMTNVTNEIFREIGGQLVPVSKPSTIVERELAQVLKVCENLDKQLSKLDPVTSVWIGQHLKDNCIEDENGKPIRFPDLILAISWPIEQLIDAAHAAEGLSSRGPNNVAPKELIAQLAYCWEEWHGAPPTTNKGRDQKDDSFLELCNSVAKIADARLQKKGGRLVSLQLTGLAAEVLKDRKLRNEKTSRKK